MSTSRSREKADGELFKSTGIDDNATSTAVTIDASENVGIGTASPTDFTNRKSLDIGTGGKIWSHNSSVETGIGNNFYYTSGYKYLTTQVASKFNQDDNGHSFQVAASGTADTAITWNTGFEVLADGKARAKNGLLFGTDTAAANTLDDYEEGTWTAVGTWGTQGTGSTNGGGGTYTKIGDTVHAAVYCTALKGTASGSFHIAGLPFAATDSVPVSLRIDGIGATSKYLMASTFNGDTNINFLLANQSSSYGSSVTPTNMAGTAYIQLQVTYRV